MDTEPVSIKLKDEAKLYCPTTARKVPFPLENAIKKETMRMLEEDVIEEVTTPTEWCAAVVPVMKPGSAICICVDMQHLIKAAHGDSYTLPYLEDISPRLKGSTVVSKVDTASGFGQMPLEESSQLLTAFITPAAGRFAFQRLPFKTFSAPELFSGKMSKLLHGLGGVEVIMDDVLTHGTEENHDKRLEACLQRLRDARVNLTKDKCKLQKSKIKFFRYLLSASGIQPDPE